MALPATRVTTAPEAPVGSEHSASAAFEQLVWSAQNVITKRIDLALLEGREIVSDTLQRAVWGAVATTMAMAAWLSLSGALVFLVFPNADTAVRLAAFTMINGVSAAAAFGVASRPSRALKRDPASRPASGSPT